MLRPVLLLMVLAALAASLAPSALGVRASVRIEGQTVTLFGGPEPQLEVKATALDALEAASAAGEFYYAVQQFSFGPFVSQIGRYPAGGNAGWVFKVNGASPPVGADKVELKEGDRVLWYYATFGATGGPPTLRLEQRPGGCYQALSQNDAGVSTPANGAVLVVDSRRRVPTRAGRACPGTHRGLVRATLDGAIRSNAAR